MKVLRPAFVALLCSLPLLAAAQWQWVDKSGRKVFSDTPPPAEIPDKSILRQPGKRPVAAVPEPAAPVAVAETPKANGARSAGKDKDLEARKKQAEAAEADKKKAEEAKLAQLRSENCNRARTGKANLDSGIRMVRANAKGEPEVMDDKQRAEERKILDDVIARDCGKPQ